MDQSPSAKNWRKISKEMDKYLKPKKKKRKKSGCYIATAVYGSYDCPQVWTLRRYRDSTLAKSLCGRAFIRIYYAVSPVMVRMFGHTNWFNAFWRERLDCWVKRLNDAGVQNTPYQDKM